MYTGIVQAVRPITRLAPYAGGTEFTLDFTPRLLEDLAIGASVSVEGVCLSVTKIEGAQVSFDAMSATLDRTNLGAIGTRGQVNIERSAKPTDENGGHEIAGHIATTARITALDLASPQAWIRFDVGPEWAKFIFIRGFLAVNGCSLTVAEKWDRADGSAEFQINLIPETLRQTTFTHYGVGDALNIEVHHQTMVLVTTIEQTLSAMIPKFLSDLAQKA